MDSAEIQREKEKTNRIMEKLHELCKNGGGAIGITPPMIGKIIRECEKDE